MSKAKRSKYIVIDEGVDFRTVANLMTNLGFEMNHATARNNFSHAMRALLENIVMEMKEVDNNIKVADVETILKNQTIYNAFPEILYKANKLLIKESANGKVANKNKFLRFSKGKK